MCCIYARRYFEMKKLQAIVLSISAIIVSVSVHAEGLLGMKAQPNTFTYNYVELNYMVMDDFELNNKAESDLDGFKFDASFDIDSNLSLIGSLSYADDKDVDLTNYSIGAAYHQKMTQTELTGSDIIIHAAIERIDVDVTGQATKGDTGLLAGATLRVKVVKEFEVFGDLSVRTAWDNDILATIGGRYAFTPKLFGVASFEISDSDTLSAGIRYNY